MTAPHRRHTAMAVHINRGDRLSTYLKPTDEGAT